MGRQSKAGASAAAGRLRATMAARTEAWRRNANIGASCLTGSAVIALTNPLDCLKSRYQVAPQSGGGVAAFARALVSGDGLWRGLWRPGLATNVCACTISVGTRIGLYPTLRDAFAPAEARRSPLFMYASGLAGGALGYSVAAPFFYATRVAHVRDLGPGLATLRRLAAPGVPALWRGAPLLVARGAVMSGTQLATYDSAKGFAVDRGLLDDGPALHCAASLCASVALTTAMVPLDVTLTHYQASPPGAGGVAACAKRLLAARGPRVFVRGWLPLWARFLPSTVLTFLIYEQARKLLLGDFLR